jgi:hypothetical protein
MLHGNFASGPLFVDELSVPDPAARHSSRMRVARPLAVPALEDPGADVAGALLSLHVLIGALAAEV